MIADAPTSSQSSSQTTPQIFDLITIGGGFVGGFLAVAAGRLGLQVLVLESRPRKTATVPGASSDIRTSAISLGSQRLLADIGVWDDQLAAQAEPIWDISISDACSSAELRYPAAEIPGGHPMGFIVDNEAMHLAIARALQGVPSVTWREGCQVTDWQAGPHAVDVLAAGQTFRAKLLVGADGRGSWTRRQANIAVLEQPYAHQASLVCQVAHTAPHHGLAHEHFTPSGPIALLPMQGLFSTLVWSTHPETAKLLEDCEESVFNQHLQTMAQGFHNIRGDLSLVGPRRVYPLNALMLEKIIGPRLVLVGDAAHVMHPVAGQGLNLGIRDVATLAKLLQQSHRCGLDIGAATGLKTYQRERRLDQITLVGTTHGLVKMFSTSSRLLAAFRGLGLRAVSRIAPVRHFLMRRAMGLA